MSKVVTSSGKLENGFIRPKALSLFSGAGGMDIGFEQAGFEVVAGVEKWKPACDTHRRNFPDTKMFEGDITDPKVKADIVEHLKGRDINVIFGGPPCTGFSLLGKRNPNDPCNYLYRDFLELVYMIRPAAFALENVDGIKTLVLNHGLTAIEAITEGAAKMGYKVELRMLLAADFSAPQLRERAILIGTRFDTPILFPEPTHGPEGSGLKPYVTVKEAIGNLENAPENEAFSHVFTDHKSDLMRRIKDMKPGQALYRRNHGCRLDPDNPAATLTNNNGSTVIHYALDRMITPRECARIQGFGDEHLFCGNKNDVGKQVGNAIPPPLAKAVSGSILKMLDMIKAGAPEWSPSPLVISTQPLEGQALKGEVSQLRQSLIRKLNVEQQKIDAASGRADCIYLRMGRFVADFIAAAKTKGETREDYLYKSIIKDKDCKGEDCKVKKGALYNACHYFQTHQAMVEKYGKAPALPMTYFVRVRNKALTIDEQHDLLIQAETDGNLTASKLNSLVAQKLKEKGCGREEPAPDAELAAHLTKALTALTKSAGLMKKGVVPSKDTLFILDKSSAMLAVCLKAAGRDISHPIPIRMVGEDASQARRAS